MLYRPRPVTSGGLNVSLAATRERLQFIVKVLISPVRRRVSQAGHETGRSKKKWLMELPAVRLARQKTLNDCL
jgi:hypothetical protein